MLMILMQVIASLDATKIVNAGLAPFVAVGTITATCTAIAAFAAKAEASDWEESARDAYVAAMINEGMAVGGAISFWPVVILIADAIT